MFRATNLNRFPLHNLSIDYSQSSSYEFNFAVFNENTFYPTNGTIKDSLNTNDSFVFKLKFLPSVALKGTIYLSLKCSESISIYIEIGANIRARYPVLSSSPASLEFRLLVGEKKFFDLDLSNIGALKATNLTWEFINKLHPFSIYDLSNGFDLELNSSIAKIVSLQSSPQDDEGFFEEKLFIQNSQVSFILPIRYFITKSSNVVLNVAIEDEFTYFSAQKPFVSNVTVTIFSSATNFKESKLTDAQGMVSFSNLTENYYNIFVKSDKHSSKSLVWAPRLSVNYLNIFIERITVRVTWSVLPKLFEDSYAVQLASEYEVYVPAPVVVIEPLQFELADFESGLFDFVTLKITNYGLIRANNFEISLPSSFEKVSFEFQTPFRSFNLSANSSIEIGVNVYTEGMKMARRKRASGGGSCGGAFTARFEYKCGPYNVRKSISASISQQCSSTVVSLYGDGNGRLINPRGGGGGGGSCNPCAAATFICLAKSITKCYKVPTQGN